MAKYCTQCGNELREEDNFCRVCGKSVSSEPFSNNTNVVVSSETNTAKVLAIIGFILSFFGFELIISLISVVLCVIAIKKSHGSKDSLKGLAIAGIIINVLKLLFIIIVAVLLYIGIYNSSFLFR